MASHTTHIRRIYTRPWCHGSDANPGKIPTCVQVGVRPETTITLETIPHSRAPLSAGRAGLARIGGVHVLDCDPHRTCLVFYKVLQLPESPAVQSGTGAPTRADAFTDVRQVFHHDPGRSDTTGFHNNTFTRFVVDMSDTPPLFAGDLPESLPRTLAAVGLQATTQGQMLIAPMAQGFTAPDPARAAGGECIFPDIHAHDRAGCDRFTFTRLDYEIEKPAAAAQHQLGLLRSTAVQNLQLMLPENHRYKQAPLEGVERDRITLECVRAVVVMHAGALKAQGRNRGVCDNTAPGALRTIGLAHREDGIASHLRPERSLLTQAPITELVQGNPIPTALFLHQWYESVARLRISASQCAQAGSLLHRRVQSNAGGTKHSLPPLGDVLGAFDVALDGSGTDTTGGAAV
jgi:hypothetical protein